MPLEEFQSLAFDIPRNRSAIDALSRAERQVHNLISNTRTHRVSSSRMRHTAWSPSTTGLNSIGGRSRRAEVPVIQCCSNGSHTGGPGGYTFKIFGVGGTKMSREANRIELSLNRPTTFCRHLGNHSHQHNGRPTVRWTTSVAPLTRLREHPISLARTRAISYDR